MRLFALSAFFLCSISAFAFQANAAKAPAPRKDMLVSTAWLADHLSDPKLVILHVGGDRSDFDRMHIPNARFLDEEKFIDMHAGPHVELPSVEQLTQAFRELGINDDSRVVIYTSEWFPDAARAYWTFDYFGHDNTALLDGGFEQWLIDHRKTATTPNTPAPGNITAHLRPQVLAKMADAKAAADGGSGIALIDARPKSRYKDGHLAGAANLYWKDTIISEKMPLRLSADKLAELYRSRNLAPGSKVITYCEVGLQASDAYFLAKYMGYEPAMYDGSFHEWETEKQPVVKGDSPR
jgi:thiosulfate/3-mercaptopyruvate sulfurtransferase